jgi:hypothetical protein
MNYIIDFKRINELTSHPTDVEISPKDVLRTTTYSISKKIVKDYLDVFLNGRYKTDDIKSHVIDTLRYNKILITKSDIREDKLKGIIDDN